MNGRRFLLALVAVVASTGVASAHVRYVTDEDGERIPLGQFLGEVLLDPVNASLLLGGGLAVTAAIGVHRRRRPAERDLHAVRETLRAYTDLVPWMLRLSVGLPLVGAGFAGYFFSPAVEVPARLFQVAVGFCILFGLATRAVAAVTLILYLIGLAFRPELLLAFEYVGGLLAIVVLGSGRPSADQLLQQVAETPGTIYGRVDPVHGLADRFSRLVGPYEAYAPTLVRVGQGVNFVFLGLYEKILSPGQALLVVDQYDLTAIVPVDPGLWVVGAGLLEIAVGLALLVGFYTRSVATVAFGLFTLTLFGLPDDPVLAHVTHFGMLSALLVTGSGPLAVDEWLSERITTPDTTVEG